MDMRNKTTTIIVQVDTRDELKQYGKKADSYDQIVKQLLKIAKESSNVSALDDYERRK